MKIAIMGSGGVGGFYGARMAQAGHDVTFIARGAHLEALRSGGLKVESPTLGELALPKVQATDDPAAVGPVELVLLTVKSYDLEAACSAMAPMVGPDTVVLPFLNGIDIAERVSAALEAAGAPGDGVLGGAVYVFANLAGPGHVRHIGLDRPIFGELAGGTSPRVEAVHAMLTGAGIPAELSTDVRKELWNKFVGLNALSGVASIARAPAGVLVKHPATRALLADSANEAVAVAKAQGVKLDPGLTDQLLALVESLAPASRPSMLVDLENGRRLEMEALQGTLVRMGADAGVPTPVNRVIHAALSPYVNGNG